MTMHLTGGCGIRSIRFHDQIIRSRLPGIDPIVSQAATLSILIERPDLCRKTRATIPAAIRRCLDQHPEIAYAILDEQDLLGPDQPG